MTNNADLDEAERPPLSLWARQLLVVGLIWASLTGIVVGMTESPLVRGLIGIAVVLLFSAAVSLFQRWAVWIALVLVAILVTVLNPNGRGIENYILGVVLASNFLLLGEFGLQLLKQFNRQQTMIRLAAPFAGAFITGFAIGVYYGPL